LTNTAGGAGIWLSGQSGRLAHRQSRLDHQQGRPPYIWTYTPALPVCFGGDIALYKNSRLFILLRCHTWVTHWFLEYVPFPAIPVSLWRKKIELYYRDRNNCYHPFFKNHFQRELSTRLFVFCFVFLFCNIFVTGIPVKFGLLAPGRARQRRSRA
jgi:hypothetical protein